MAKTVTKVDMTAFDEKFAPTSFKMTFDSGETATYTRVTNPSDDSKIMPRVDYCKQKFNEHDFAGHAAKCETQFKLIDEDYRVARREAQILFEKLNIVIEGTSKSLSNHNQLSSKPRDEHSPQKPWKKMNNEEHSRVNKEVDDGGERLTSPSARLEMIIKMLQAVKADAPNKAAEMLTAESVYILEKLKEPTWVSDSFLSYVQIHSADLCRRMCNSLNEKGISTSWDMEAKRLDARGIIDGIVNARLFLLTLSKQYFLQLGCIFEYCVALVAARPIITVVEADSEHGGGSISSFKVAKPFRDIHSHEIIHVRKGYWTAFVSKLVEIMKSELSKKHFAAALP